MKKEYIEPEFETRILFTELMTGDNVKLSEPEYGTHNGVDDDDGDLIIIDMPS